MVFIKQGVILNGLKPEILIGHTVVKSVFDELGYDVVITCGVNGKHGRQSKHYSGYAIDYRSKHIYDDLLRMKILEKCQEALGENFDFILECENTPNEHFHLEYDPK